MVTVKDTLTNLTFLLTALCTVGCSSMQRSDKAFEEYIQSYQYELRARGVTGTNQYSPEVTVKFGSVPYLPGYNSDALAVTRPASWQGSAEVTVSRDAWSRLSGTEREVLIYHEMSHAVGCTHTVSGIMQPRLMNATEYKAKRKQLLDDLFTCTLARARCDSGNPFEQLARIK